MERPYQANFRSGALDREGEAPAEPRETLDIVWHTARHEPRPPSSAIVRQAPEFLFSSSHSHRQTFQLHAHFSLQVRTMCIDADFLDGIGSDSERIKRQERV